MEARFASTDERAITAEFLSDNGGAFRATETHALAHELGIKSVHTLVNSPQSNDMAESFVNTLDAITSAAWTAALRCGPDCPTPSHTSTRCIRIRRLGTNRRACLGKSEAVRLWKLTLTKHQVASAKAGGRSGLRIAVTVTASSV